IDLRGGFGRIVTGYLIHDWGYRPDGVPLSSDQRGMYLRGVEGASVTGNTMSLRDWANNDHNGIQIQNFTYPDTTVVESRRNVISGNQIFGVTRGINEGNSSTDNAGDNFISATVPV